MTEQARTHQSRDMSGRRDGEMGRPQSTAAWPLTWPTPQAEPTVLETVSATKADGMLVVRP